ncbi:MAG TPA: DUF1571 domain-containing protein [Isosphaeraceae bacterium]
MVAIMPMAGRAAGLLRRRKWLGVALTVPALVVLTSWWLTAPLEEEEVASPALSTATPAPAPTASTAPGRPAWPEGRVEGTEAKMVLLAVLEDAARRIDAASGYVATFKKQERIGGRLLPEQTMAMKVRQRPFAVYLKFLAPKAGKEVLYAEGHRKNKVLAHNGDWTRRLVPRLEVAPDSPTALADNRHPITEAGLSNLAHKLVAFRKLDLGDPEAITILDRTTGPDGRPLLRSVHLHEHPNASRPFARIEVLYDPATHFPVQISSHDWPHPGEAGEPLVERYAYEGLVLDPPLTALDFDPANPAYEFLRY